MRRIALAAALAFAAMTLAGCKSVDEVFDDVARALRVISTSVDKARDMIVDGCSAIAKAEAYAEQLAATVFHCKPFHTAVVRERTVSAGICQNVQLLTDREVGNYAEAIGRAVKRAQSAKPEGC